jgi:hypothetical protein
MTLIRNGVPVPVPMPDCASVINVAATARIVRMIDLRRMYVSPTILA